MPGPLTLPAKPKGSPFSAGLRDYDQLRGHLWLQSRSAPLAWLIAFTDMSFLSRYVLVVANLAATRRWTYPQKQ